MRFFLSVLVLCALSVPAQANEPAPGFHEAMLDCFAAVLTPNAKPFPQAYEFGGNPETGYTAWYTNDAEEPIYGVKLATQDGVTVCSGPAPMGPFLDAYLAGDHVLVEIKAAGLGLVPLNVPVEGYYFANCSADKPDQFLQVVADQTQRVGFKFIRSPNVGDTCAKFSD